jgi:hypothetical protein
VTVAYADMHTSPGRFGEGLLSALGRGNPSGAEEIAAFACLAHALQCAAGWVKK